jgi:cytochrome b561
VSLYVPLRQETLYGTIHLPQILPHDDSLYVVLRTAHTVLAYLFFATILMHVAVAVFHALIRRDGVFQAMATIWDWSRSDTGSRP